MASGWEKRVWCCAKFGEILLIGEQIRMKMHTDDLQLIKDRRYFMKTYPSCFLGSETIDWLIDTKQTPTREMGLVVLNILRENNILHHVTDSPYVKDDSSLYRFRKDDSTYPWGEDLAIFLRGQRIFKKLLGGTLNKTMKTCERHGRMYRNAFEGRHLVDWLVESKEVNTRQEAIEEGRLLLQNDVLRHVTDSQHFKDEPFLYQFKIDYSRELTVMDLVLPPEESDDLDCGDKADGGSVSCVKSKVKSEVEDNSGSPSGAKDIPSNLGRDRPTRSESGYHSDLHDSPSSPPSSFKPESPETEANNSGYLRRVSSLNMSTPTGMLMRKATVEELQSEDSPFKKRQVRVAQDPVGYGFVIRGDGPSFVKTVDPMGPAAKAGLRVGQYIYSINDEFVVDLNHKDLAHIIVNSDGYMNMVVMEHVHDQPVG